MKQLTIILGILLAALGCADNKKGDPATLDDGSSKRMTELDSLSKISIIKDTTVRPGFNRVNRNGQRMGMWKEVDNFYTEIEYSEVRKIIIRKEYSRLTGSLIGFCVIKSKSFDEVIYSFEDYRHLEAVFSDFRIIKEPCDNDNSNNCLIYKYRCRIAVYFRNGALSQLQEEKYNEDPEIDGETIWTKYFRKDGSESDIDMMEYAIAQNRDERRLDINQTDSCGRRQGLWLEDDGYREVYYKDGVVDGIFRSYSRKTGTLLSIGWYCKGMLSGRWFYFDEQGKLLRIDDHPDLEGSPVWLANSYLSK